MIRVLEKTEKILVYLSENRAREVPLTEIADNLNINRATCANILKTLKDLNLIEQMNYRKGYVLGEKIYSIAGNSNNHDRLRTLLKPVVDTLCREVNENVMLSVIKNDSRILLYSAEANHAIVAKVIYEMKVWEATTAKVILARYSPEKLDNFVKLAGMPGEDWPEVRTRQDLMDKMSEIRSQVCFTVINRHFACMAAPVFMKGEVVASIGYYLPDMRLTDTTGPVLERKLTEAVRQAGLILDKGQPV